MGGVVGSRSTDYISVTLPKLLWSQSSNPLSCHHIFSRTSTCGLEILIVQSPSVSYQIGIEQFFEILCLLSGNTIFAPICPFPLSYFSPKCLKIALHTCKPDIVHFVQYNCIEINIFFFCLPFLCSPKIQPQVRYFQLNIYFGVYCRQKICHDIF